MYSLLNLEKMVNVKSNLFSVHVTSLYVLYSFQAWKCFGSMLRASFKVSSNNAITDAN